MSYIVYCPDNDKYLDFHSVNGSINWNEIYRSVHSDDEIDLIEKIYLGKAHVSMKGKWNPQEWEAMVELICDARDEGWVLYVIPISRSTYDFGLMEQMGI